jgi:hypothetical protein
MFNRIMGCASGPQVHNSDKYFGIKTTKNATKIFK